MCVKLLVLLIGLLNLNATASSLDELAVDTLACPNACVCQYASFGDLSVSRWINKLLERSNVYYNPLQHDFIKQATCLLQANTEPHALFSSLPIDLQALVLLYTDASASLTVNTSTLALLNQLSILEMRGDAQARAMRLNFDAPLSFLQHAYFERITLMGSERVQHPRNARHPSEEFDYKPRSEQHLRLEYELSSTKKLQPKQLAFETVAEDVDNDNDDDDDDAIDILPYDVYVQQMKRSRIPTFYGWSHLETLVIHGCQLSELYWEVFDGLRSLQHLSLERNDIAELYPFALYGALHLKSLSLAHNRLHRLHYRELAGLLELELLNLRDNRLTSLSELSFPPFPQLRYVDFRDNPIEQILPATFRVMNNTREMAFASTRVALELYGNQPFESLNKLRELTISNVTIDELNEHVFKGLNAIQKLTLQGSIRSIEFDAFAGLRELKVLQLSDCNIQQLSMDAFMGCKKLQRLDLHNNNISSIPAGAFDDQQQLSELYLHNNQLHTLPTNVFRLPQLRVVRLHNNPWQCSCDMNDWLSKITNAEQLPSIERCIKDYTSGQNIACRRVDNYIHRKSFTPRCANYNGRSVFYVLRKQLQCGDGHLLSKHKRNNQQDGRQSVPHWLKLAEHFGKTPVAPKKQRMWPRRRNELDYVLGIRATTKASKVENNEEISNEI